MKAPKTVVKTVHYGEPNIVYLDGKEIDIIHDCNLWRSTDGHVVLSLKNEAIACTVEEAKDFGARLLHLAVAIEMENEETGKRSQGIDGQQNNKGS